MTGRVRKPTARALDAAQSRLLENAIASDRRRSASSTSNATASTSNAAAVKRRGRAVNAKGQTAVAQDQARASALSAVGDDHDSDADDRESQEQHDADADQQGDLTLYCVCLGYDTGEEPMIQCEHCMNWFHFGCIGITEEFASQIEGYACEMCQQMGVGSTRMLANASLPAPPSSTTRSRNRDRDHQVDENEDEDEEQDEGIEEDEDMMGEDDDEDYGEDGSARKRRRGKQAATRADRAARRRKVENSNDDAADDSDSFDEEEDDQDKPKNRGKKKQVQRSSTTPARPVDPSTAPAVPQTEKTRAAVVKQFTSTFSSIYSASSSSDAEDVTHRATAFAEAVEEELFADFCELDDKGQTRMPRAKYASKFRSLQFNLKTNAVFRSRIAHDEFDASGIVNISAEDLQTPELKAMAESVRAASLKNSVKEALVAPTAKRTHKGEEEMENNSARLIAEEEAALKEIERKKAAEQKERERSASFPQTDSPFPEAYADSPQPHDPSESNAEGQSESFSRARPRPSLTGSSSHINSFLDDQPSESAPSPSGHQGSPESGSRSPGKDGEEGAMSPPPQPRQRNSSTSIDMSAIWGKAKAASPSLEPQDAAGDDPSADANENEDDKPFESDMFDFTSRRQHDDDDDFENGLFRSEADSPPKKAPRPPTEIEASKPPAISELPPVWAGDVLVTEEGGFPAFGVQVGGRPLGTDARTWQKLLPRGLTTAGRISSHQASKYLIDCSFAPTRELTIVALLPDTTGPSAHFPHKPTAERCLAKQSHIYEHYLQRDRIGVVQPPKELAALVKDIYIIPLPKEHPLPEYVELLDEHVLPEGGKRDQNLLLLVLVQQKGALPTNRASYLASSTPALPPSKPPVPSTTSSVPPSSAPPGPPPLDPAAFQSLLSGVDPSSLQSLLSNPQALSALTGAQSQAVLNTANSQPELPLSIPTGPRASSHNKHQGGGPPIHPSRLQQVAIDPNAYSTIPPTGPASTMGRSPHSRSSGGGGSGGYDSQGHHYEDNLTGGTDGYNQGMGDGGWSNAPAMTHHRGGYRGGGRGGDGGGYRGGGGRGRGGYNDHRGGGYGGGGGYGRGGY
ncbi:uncharacterized protein JCM15063_005116 [Sporobolomyces koalae]|uniref:uncharacterized protein n=1 Tax=Sporobolomyces koalae TaxID=500713 RepID=UPI00316F93C4